MAHQKDSQEPRDAALSPADAAALDAFMDSTDAAVEAARLERMRAWIHAIQVAPAPVAPPQLLQGTLDAIQRDRMKLPASTGAAAEVTAPRNTWGRRLREIGAMGVAAAILVAVLIPAVGYARKSSARVACATNMLHLGDAFAEYAHEHEDELPALAMPADGNWLPRGPGLRGSVGIAQTTDAHSNAANLLPLVNAHYASAQMLLCAGRSLPADTRIDLSSGDIPDNVRGYSYVNLYGPISRTWDGRRASIILADRNPMFGAIASDDPHANSFNHGGSGNYLLRGDKSISWETTPDVGPGNDNIWTIGKECQRYYRGTEVSTNASDTFLSP